MILLAALSALAAPTLDVTPMQEHASVTAVVAGAPVGHDVYFVASHSVGEHCHRDRCVDLEPPLKFIAFSSVGEDGRAVITGRLPTYLEDGAPVAVQAVVVVDGGTLRSNVAASVVTSPLAHIPAEPQLVASDD